MSSSIGLHLYIRRGIGAIGASKSQKGSGKFPQRHIELVKMRDHGTFCDFFNDINYLGKKYHVRPVLMVLDQNSDRSRK